MNVIHWLSRSKSLQSLLKVGIDYMCTDAFFKVSNDLETFQGEDNGLLWVSSLVLGVVWDWNPR